MKKKKILSWMLTFAMVFSVGLPTGGSVFGATGENIADMSADWSKDAMEAAVANGLLTGVDQNGRSYLMPNAPLTRAQMASIINKAFNASAKADLSSVEDVSAGDWFYNHMAMAVQLDSFSLANAMRPNDNITREEAFTVLAKVFKLQIPADTGALDAFADSGNVSSWAADRICALISAGYVTGSGNMLNPKANITRAEFAAVMDNIVAQYIKAPGEYTTVAAGNIVVQVPGVTLKGVTVDGDLILADGVGTDTVTLQDVIVTGALVVRSAAKVEQLGTTKIGGQIVVPPAAAVTPTDSAVEATKPASVSSGGGGGGGGGGSSGNSSNSGNSGKTDDSNTYTATTIELFVSEDEFNKESTTSAVVFQAKFNGTVGTVKLYEVYADGKKAVCELKDDGSNGDAKKADGIYSGRDTIDQANEKDYSYYAVAEGKTELRSENVTIRVINRFTTDQIKMMTGVETSLGAILTGSAFTSAASIAEKKELVKTALDQLATDGGIKGASIEYSESDELYSFEYASGVLGAISLKDWEESQENEATATNGSGSEGADASAFTEGGQQTEDSGLAKNNGEPVSADNGEQTEDPGLAENNGEPVSADEGQQTDDAVPAANRDEVAADQGQPESRARIEIKNSAPLYPAQSDIFTVFSKESKAAQDIMPIGKAVILYSFDQGWSDDSWRTDFYDGLKTAWDSKGLITTIPARSTVAEYKKLSDYDVVCFSAHGLTYPATDDPVILLSEEASKEKDEAYFTDLKESRIVKITVSGGTKYGILPSFFSHHYAGNKLEDVLIFAESCEFMGKDNMSGDTSDDTSNTKMSDAIFKDAGAEMLVGFSGTVTAAYSQAFLEAFFADILEKKTAEDALDAAKEEVDGSNEKPEVSVKLFGKDARLVNAEILNGSFEEMLRGWDRQGDVRTITSLGAIEPESETGSCMAIITTGDGSNDTVDSGFIDGLTEGGVEVYGESVLSQTFIVPEDMKTLSFCYDFITEELPEYYDKGYNDSFFFQIEANSYKDQDKLASVDHGKEYPELPPDEWGYLKDYFEGGGDITTCRKGWEKVTYDISEWAGQTITIRFLIYDFGDEGFTSAAFIDLVELSASEGGRTIGDGDNEEEDNELPDETDPDALHPGSKGEEDGDGNVPDPAEEESDSSEGEKLSSSDEEEPGSEDASEAAEQKGESGGDLSGMENQSDSASAQTENVSGGGSEQMDEENISNRSHAEMPDISEKTPDAKGTDDAEMTDVA